MNIQERFSNDYAFYNAMSGHSVDIVLWYQKFGTSNRTALSKRYDLTCLKYLIASILETEKLDVKWSTI